MRIQPEISSCSIILVGDLNPKIFRPDWFVAQGLLTAEEGENAEIEVIHSELSLFRTEWSKIQVDKRRFIAETQESPFVRLSDLVTRTFSEFLIHTPISMLGINRTVHFPLKNHDEVDRIGKTIAPQDAWGEWGREISDQADQKKHGGLRSMTMEQNNLSDRTSGHIRAKIEPSLKVAYGVFMEVNDHYEITAKDEAKNCEEMIQALSDNFEKSVKRSEWIIDQIMSIVN